MTQTDPETQKIIDAINAVGGSGTSNVIGMSKGQKPVGTYVMPGGTPQKNFTYNQAGYLAQANPFVAGDEQKPGAGTQAQIQALQQKLVMAGLLSPDTVRWTHWDSASANAYKVVLAYANVHAMDAHAALRDFLNAPLSLAEQKRLQGPNPKASSAPGPYQVSNAGNLAATYQGEAANLVGGDLDKSEADQFAKQYQAQELQAWQQRADANIKGSLTYAGPETDQNAADTAIRASHMDKVIGYGMASRMQEFFNMLKGV